MMHLVEDAEYGPGANLSAEALEADLVEIFGDRARELEADIALHSYSPAL